MKKGLNIAYLNGAEGLGRKAVGGSGGSTSKPKWTGHADAEGLKAIGWTDEDIAYYQENGVNWNEEDDQYHKVSEDNIALYGVLTADNIGSYRDRIVYLPKIDTSGKTSMSEMFNGCYSLVSIPVLDTSNVTNMSYMFRTCYSLVSIPKLNTSNVTNMGGMFYSCYSLLSIPSLDTSSVTDMGQTFDKCYSANTLNLNGLKVSLKINNTSLLTKDSLLYMINNEASTSTITITLSSYCYDKYASDADVMAALSNHPNVSLAK